MAVQAPIPVEFGLVFPHGAYVLDVSPVEDFDKPAGTDRQTRDKTSGVRLWAVRVMDPDPLARKGQAEVSVKLAADVQPVPPETLAGTPFRPVIFDGLSITPYVDERRSRPRVAYSLRASSMRSAGVGVEGGKLRRIAAEPASA
jgi:hypothetical protein